MEKKKKIPSFRPSTALSGLNKLYNDLMSERNRIKSFSKGIKIVSKLKVHVIVALFTGVEGWLNVNTAAKNTLVLTRISRKAQRLCYTGRFATKIFSAALRCNFGQCCYYSKHCLNNVVTLRVALKLFAANRLV